MILTPIPLAELPSVLQRFHDALDDQPLARTVFGRIADTLVHVREGDLSLSQDVEHHRQAVALAASFGMVIIDESPTAGFTWDGSALRVGMEPSVIIHDVAHFQLCAPGRRGVADFGLGAGPETGMRDEADTAMRLFGVERELEEALTSLLGILWEAVLDQPAVCAFLEQNWLEGVDRPQGRDHFVKIATFLGDNGFIDPTGRPTRKCRTLDDTAFFTDITSLKQGRRNSRRSGSRRSRR